MLVIYDSFIHSGSIRPELRSRFPEVPPAQGGNEQEWIRQYVDVRDSWLRNHPNPVLHATIYRTRTFKDEIARGNWDLTQLPIIAHGIAVDDRHDGGHPMGELAAAAGGHAIPYLGDPDADGGEIWCEEAGAIWNNDRNAERDMAAAAPAETAAALATSILASGRIELATTHASGKIDHANARQQMEDTAAGRAAQRSSYGTAPGGAVKLDKQLLRGILALADRYSYAVSELAGGSHNPNSRHYAGLGVDINEIDGRPVRAGHPELNPFKALCRHLGATEVLGPGEPGHATHVHAAWPRP
jgi:hypothetical protein